MGKVGQATEPDEMKGKWFFQVWMLEFGKGEPSDEDTIGGPVGPWETEEAAQKELRRAVQAVCEKVSELVDGKASGEYIDLKTNVRRKWDKSNEN